MKRLSSVIFDVDGVLLDSLTPHLKICRDKNIEYGLGLSIPTPDEFKKMVRQGIKISPMKFFFQAVGFPNEYVDLALAQYEESFMRDYAPKSFSQIGEMLSRLASKGLILGIVTSNVRPNVDSALGPNIRFFKPECILTKEDGASDSKSDTLISVARRLHLDITEIMYVGDQPADWMAAKKAHTRFLGVTYGWGISEEDTEFPVVNNVMGIATYILNEAI